MTFTSLKGRTGTQKKFKNDNINTISIVMKLQWEISYRTKNPSQKKMTCIVCRIVLILRWTHTLAKVCLRESDGNNKIEKGSSKNIHVEPEFEKVNNKITLIPVSSKYQPYIVDTLT